MSVRKEVLIGLLLFFVIIVFYFTFFIWSRGELPVIEQGEPFNLEAINGEFYESDNEKVKLLAFFYTRCPNICPMTMFDFSQMQAQLKEDGLFGTDVELIAITLDPEFDDLNKINQYAQSFSADTEGWKFLRGTPSETKHIANNYHMKYQKVSGDFIAHNTTMFLLDQNHAIRGLYDMANVKERVDQQEIMKAIKTLVDE